MRTSMKMVCVAVSCFILGGTLIAGEKVKTQENASKEEVKTDSKTNEDNSKKDVESDEQKPSNEQSK